MIELQQLRQLVAVYEHGSISAAARELHLSQPALSRSIRRLEEDLDLELLDHGQNRIRFSPVGVRAVELSRSLLREMEELPRTLRSYARSITTISIGSCGPAPMWNLAAELGETFPENTIHSEVKPTEDLVEDLLQGRFHLIVTDRPIQRAGILCRLFAEEHLMLSVPPEHPFSTRKSLWLEELEGQTMLVYHDRGVWLSRLKKLDELNIHFIEQKERDTLSDLVRSSSLPCIDSNMIHNLMAYGQQRITIPILDEEARVTYYACAVPENERLLARVTFSA